MYTRRLYKIIPIKSQTSKSYVDRTWWHKLWRFPLRSGNFTFFHQQNNFSVPLTGPFKGTFNLEGTFSLWMSLGPQDFKNIFSAGSHSVYTPRYWDTKGETTWNQITKYASTVTHHSQTITNCNDTSGETFLNASSLSLKTQESDSSVFNLGRNIRKKSHFDVKFVRNHLPEKIN